MQSSDLVSKSYIDALMQGRTVISEEEAKQKITWWPNTTLSDGHMFYDSKNQIGFASMAGKWTIISGGGGHSEIQSSMVSSMY